jgi:hypothetical protein
MDEFIEAVSADVCWWRKGELLTACSHLSSNASVYFHSGGRAVDGILESNNIFVSTKQEMRCLFQKPTITVFPLWFMVTYV